MTGSIQDSITNGASISEPTPDSQMLGWSRHKRHKNLRDFLVKGYFGEPSTPDDPELALDRGRLITGN